MENSNEKQSLSQFIDDNLEKTLSPNEKLNFKQVISSSLHSKYFLVKNNFTESEIKTMIAKTTPKIKGLLKKDSEFSLEDANKIRDVADKQILSALNEKLNYIERHCSKKDKLFIVNLKNTIINQKNVTAEEKITKMSNMVLDAANKDEISPQLRYIFANQFTNLNHIKPTPDQLNAEADPVIKKQNKSPSMLKMVKRFVSRPIPIVALEVPFIIGATIAKTIKREYQKRSAKIKQTKIKITSSSNMDASQKPQTNGSPNEINLNHSGIITQEDRAKSLAKTGANIPKGLIQASILRTQSNIDNLCETAVSQDINKLKKGINELREKLENQLSYKLGKFKGTPEAKQALENHVNSELKKLDEHIETQLKEISQKQPPDNNASFNPS